MWLRSAALDTPGLPTRRTSLGGTDLDGNDVVLSFTISRKLYRCPGCRNSIAIGTEHVLVRYAQPAGETYHQHWHFECASAVVRELRNLRPGSPHRPPRSEGRRRR